MAAAAVLGTILARRRQVLNERVNGFDVVPSGTAGHCESVGSRRGRSVGRDGGLSPVLCLGPDPCLSVSPFPSLSVSLDPDPDPYSSAVAASSV